MSVLVVGLSHNSAPVRVLERAAVSGDRLAKPLSDLACAGPPRSVRFQEIFPPNGPGTSHRAALRGDSVLAIWRVRGGQYEQ